MGPSTSAAAVSAPVTQKSTDKSRRRPTSDLAEQQMSTAFSQLTNALRKRQSNPSDIEDECDLYGKLLAKKIRELPNDERKLIMYEIDGLVIRKIKQRSISRKSRDTSSPQYVSSPRLSSASSRHTISSICSLFSLFKWIHTIKPASIHPITTTTSTF
ncbi:unnamed protein product [Arctia plantaginis]|uniref:Uncharacterized protein n=1 Tax=Arctia plantaginis TaxID=874455 RepID=A0A8S1BR59_ARCPL|nr:unnamed protein product [Arctia plantaginis]